MPYAATELRLRQHAAMAPRMQQSVQLLQLSALEFSLTIQHALNTNPFLEDEDLAESTWETRGETDLEDAPTEATPPQENIAPDGVLDESGIYSGDYPTRVSANSGEPLLPASQWLPATQTLQSRLRDAVRLQPLSDRDALLSEYIIDAIDDDGYLRQPFSSLGATSELSPPPSHTEWQIALHLIQQLLSPGIGARDLRECLTLQLRAPLIDNKTPNRVQLALDIVQEHLHLMARNDWSALLRVTKASSQELREATDLIKSLDPRPGRCYDPETPAYVVPDVTIRKLADEWQVIPNRHAMPRPSLNQQYAELFRHARCDDRAPLAQELQEARWLVKNIEQRHVTIQRVAEVIVRRQQRFFEYGEVAIRPLLLREVADELEIHESTVSRATANKYMDTPRGIFEFRRFFSRELNTASGGTCSAAAVQALIREFIENEKPDEPLSDVTLTEKLAEDGIVVARRTVSKYRALMKLPSAELRRKH